jgi:nitrogen fixation/metabolism regulation signal transduction histidine kinase
MGSGVSGSVLRADLRRAVATANSAAARAQTMNVTNALTVLTDNLQSAVAQVNAGIRASARTDLSHDAAAAASACGDRPT